MTAPDPPVLGRWRLLRADPSLEFAPGVSMDFQTGGRLLYAFDAGNRRQVIALCYRVEGDLYEAEGSLALGLGPSFRFLLPGRPLM